MDVQIYIDADPMPVSTGHLPDAAVVQVLVEAAYE
jgi:hypothetical protein